MLNILCQHCGDTCKHCRVKIFEVELLQDAKGIRYLFISIVTVIKFVVTNGVSFTWKYYTAINQSGRVLGWTCGYSLMFGFFMYGYGFLRRR